MYISNPCFILEFKKSLISFNRDMSLSSKKESYPFLRANPFSLGFIF